MRRALIASSSAAFTEPAAAVLAARFAVSVVTDADAALRFAHASMPAVTVVASTLDGDLPGAEVAGLIARRPDPQPFVVIGAGPPEDAAAFYDAGVEAFEPWPFDAARFAAHADVLERRLDRQAELTARIERLESRGRDLAEAERVKDDLVHMLVHDLKNPVTAVLGLLDVVLSDGANVVPSSLYRLVRLAREESQHLLSLAANILDVRRMQLDKLILNRGAMDASAFEDVLDAALQDLGAVAAERVVTREVPADLPAFMADADILRRVFTNLLSNAVKHTSRGGRVHVAARAVPDAVEFAVRDDGEGIPAEDLDRIFRPFEQSRVTVHDRFDSGMGLTFCKLAVEEHGGRIWVRSTRGRGSTFYVSLPSGVDVANDVVELVD